MKFCFAPLEGIGGYIYRNAQAEFFPRADKYVSPFLMPNQNRSFSSKEQKEIAPENNTAIHLVPQILTNDAEIFLRAARDLKELGYTEVNLNLGCPSRTVVTKCRGAGFLANPERLDAFLAEIFASAEMKISVKTRLGLEDPEEFSQLLAIYNKYPMEELVIHPRVQKDFYKNRPRLETFREALTNTEHRIVYNGDLFSKKDFDVFCAEFPEIDCIMAGRGVLANPCLFGTFRGEALLTKERLRQFHERLLEDYTREMSGEKNVLFKMKELWYYMSQSFMNSEKYAKKIRKAQRLVDYNEAVRSLFAEQELCDTMKSGPSFS